ncbi:MAG: ABC transporter ATP-binding protein [Cyanobium sp. MAG06]|nr:ABC transporter ATP-binding protein [Cyanobium sp. MAG06]
MDNNTIVQLNNINKSFREGKNIIKILKDVNLTIKNGEKVAIIGPSGSGKSTLLSLIAGLDHPDSGNIIVNNRDISKLSINELSEYRNRDIGIIFQSFELILPFTVMENITAPSDIAGKYNNIYAKELLSKIKMTDKSNSSCLNLSGGEKQRVAIARALINNPELILADEPTGSLDIETGKNVLDLLISLVEEQKKTMIIITHDENIAKKMDRVFLLKDLQLIEYKYNK